MSFKKIVSSFAIGSVLLLGAMAIPNTTYAQQPEKQVSFLYINSGFGNSYYGYPAYRSWSYPVYRTYYYPNYYSQPYYNPGYFNFGFRIF